MASRSPRMVKRSPRRPIVTSSAVSIWRKFSSSTPQRLARCVLLTGENKSWVAFGLGIGRSVGLLAVAAVILALMLVFKIP